MKGIYALVVLSLLTCFALPAFALPTDVEVQRYLLAAIKKNEAGDYQGAKEYYDKIIALNVTVPVDFYFHYGVVLNKSGDYTRAFVWLEKYINKAGQSGKYYLDALDQLTTAEEGKAASDKKKKMEYSERLVSALNDSVYLANNKVNSRNERLPSWYEARGASLYGGFPHAVVTKYLNDDPCTMQIYYKCNGETIIQLDFEKRGSQYYDKLALEPRGSEPRPSSKFEFENQQKAELAYRYYSEMADVCK